MKFEIVNPPDLIKPVGYSHGIVASGNRLLFIAGQVGLDENGPAADLATQFKIALDNVKKVLEAAGGRPEDLARLTIYVTNIKAYLKHREQLAPIYQEFFGRHYPAMSLLEVRNLIDPRLMVEIEGTAVLP